MQPQSSPSSNIPLDNKDYVRFYSDTHGTPVLHANHMFPTAVFKIHGIDEDSSPSTHQNTGGPLREVIRERIRSRHNTANAQADSPLQARNTSGRQLDVFDYYGTWKLFDALCDAAFSGTNRNFALGDTPEQRFMGTWSDGIAVKELHIKQKP